MCSDYSASLASDALHQPNADQSDEHAGVTELVQPDALDHLPSGFERVDEVVREHDQHESGLGDRHVRDEHEHGERCGVGQAVPEQHAPVLALELCHPGVLEGEVADEVYCTVEHQKVEERNRHWDLLGAFCAVPGSVPARADLLTTLWAVQVA